MGHLVKGNVIKTFTGHNNSVWSLAVLTDGTLASSCNDATFEIWHIVKGNEPIK
jgi:WD40 repeat protein